MNYSIENERQFIEDMMDPAGPVGQRKEPNRTALENYRKLIAAGLRTWPLDERGRPTVDPAAVILLLDEAIKALYIRELEQEYERGII